MGHLVQRWQHKFVLLLLVVTATANRLEQQPLQEVHYLGRSPLRWPVIPWPRVPTGLLCYPVALRRSRCRCQRLLARQLLL
uniref:Putative secreted protein n=1 Tax=Anopheles triannulatus TaxID=58253 RepID=A0A2M4B2M7_9DIPT